VLALTGTIFGTAAWPLRARNDRYRNRRKLFRHIKRAGSKLRVNGVLSAAAWCSTQAALFRSGKVKTISGAGKIGPGNSPGILTAESLDPSGGTGFILEFTDVSPNYGDATTSFNDVLISLAECLGRWPHL